MSRLFGFITGACPSIRINGDSVVEDATASDVRYVLPTLESGAKAPYILLSSTADVQFNLGDSAVLAVNGPMVSAQMPYLFRVRGGDTHFALITTDGGTKNDLSVSPVDIAGRHEIPMGLAIGASDTDNITVASAVATTPISIPTMSNGKKAHYVMLRGAPTIYVKPALTGDTIHSPLAGMRLRNQFPHILDVSGYEIIAATLRTGTNQILYVSPIEV